MDCFVTCNGFIVTLMHFCLSTDYQEEFLFKTILFIDKIDPLTYRRNLTVDQGKLDFETIVIGNVMSQLRRTGLFGCDNYSDKRVSPDDANSRLNMKEVRSSGLDLSGGLITLKGAGRLEGF